MAFWSPWQRKRSSLSRQTVCFCQPRLQVRAQVVLLEMGELPSRPTDRGTEPGGAGDATGNQRVLLNKCYLIDSCLRLMGKR